MRTGIQSPSHEKPIAIVAVTRNGVGLALRLREKLPGSVCFVPRRHEFALAMGATGFDHLGSAFHKIWKNHRAMVCIMATGIVVRLLSRLLRNKATDPAVVVLDERARFAVSLVSGHLGGANDLAREVASLTGGQAVITTASDVNELPSLDVIAKSVGLHVENAAKLPRAARAILEDETLWVFDPESRLREHLHGLDRVVWVGDEILDLERNPVSGKQTVIWVSERIAPKGLECLFLRPRNLVVGVGCNRGTGLQEILGLLREVFRDSGFSLESVRNLATVDLKREEPGLLLAAERLNRPIDFFSASELGGIDVPNPSPVVESHIGVQSVCEAAALLSAGKGHLVIAKRKSPNVTLAVARVDCPS